MKVVRVTAEQASALQTAGKYRPGVPLFWVQGSVVFADATEFSTWWELQWLSN